MKVVILGASGMLGSAVLEQFRGFSLGAVYATTRGQASKPREQGLTGLIFDATKDKLEVALQFLAPGDFLINCIGVIKSEIDETSPDSISRAFEINRDFSLRLADFAQAKGLKVIQIATDCVYSGATGQYSEKSEHDPVDVYGKSKSEGEVKSPNVMHLRVSIIGPENRGFTSLYEWVNRQPPAAVIAGYTDHYWNGIPAMHFGKLARAIIEADLFQAGTYHLVPRNIVSKARLVRLIAVSAGRRDLEIKDAPSGTLVDRSLSTINRLLNEKLWAAAGYPDLPSIEDLVSEINPK